MSYRAYTGVGSRKTPRPVLRKMRRMATTLARHGLVLRSGRAEGADRAFERGADKALGAKEIFIPWEGFGPDCKTGCPCTAVLDDAGYLAKYTEERQALITRAMDIAQDVHPNWSACSRSAQLLHARNVFQVLGSNLDERSMFLICWTKGGRDSGGTRTAIMVARRNNVPCYNLGSYDWTLREILESVRGRRARHG